MSETKFTKGEWSVLGEIVIASKGAVVIKPLASGNITPQEDEANALLIAKAPKMYKILESVISELYMLIDEVNDQRASHITSQTESEPDYHDMQTLHEIQCLLAEIRGDKP